jgi:protein-tyrosine kinase
MSRLYEALRRSETENLEKAAVIPEVSGPDEVFSRLAEAPVELEGAPNVRTLISAESHLVAVSEPQSLAAEKFRVLVTRLNNLRAQRELKSVQVTSAIADEGKTIIAANLSLTLARHAKSRVLLLEGDLHRPGLNSILGVRQLKGIREWWSNGDAHISSFLNRIDDLPLWFLPSGGQCDQPVEILQSGRFAEQLAQITGWFDWVVVDSTPLLPMADANIWNRLVDGMLLVVREGVTPIKALKKGLESLDNAKLLGVVLNGASEFDRVNYYDQYYATSKASNNGHAKSQGAEVSA